MKRKKTYISFTLVGLLFLVSGIVVGRRDSLFWIPLLVLSAACCFYAVYSYFTELLKHGPENRV